MQVAESNNAEEEEERQTAQFCADLRRLQQRSKCTEAICADIVATFGKYLNISPQNFRAQDKKMQQAAGVKFLRLNGCVGCHKFVYLPSDPRRQCPYINKNGSVCGCDRLNVDNKPREVFAVCNSWLPAVPA